MRHAERMVVLLAALSLAAASASAAEGDGAFETVPRVAPSWTRQFDAPVLWHRVTPLGHVIVATTTSLQGLDPASGTAVWAHAGLGDVTAGRYAEIPGTALLLLAAEGRDGRAMILDSIDGRIVFDSSRWGVATVLAARVLPRAGGLLVVGPQVGEPRTRMLLFDLATGERRWVNDDLLGGMGKLAAALATLVQAGTGESGLAGDPLEIGDDAFLVPTRMGVYAIDAATGRTLWKAPGGDEVRLYLTPERPDRVVIGATLNDEINGHAYRSSSYAAYRLADGTPVWPEPVSMGSEVNDPVYLEEGMILSPGGDGGGKMNLVDYDTGETRWGKKGKGLKAPGGIVDHVATRAGLVVTTGKDSAWTDRGMVYSLNVLDTATGTMRFEKPLKVKGRILDIEVLDKGVLYRTTHEIGLFDPTTGGPLGSPVVSDDPLVTADQGDRLWAFSASDGGLWQADRAASSVTRVSSGKVKLGDDDVPWALEAHAEAVTLLSSQNLVVFGHDGAMRLHVHYPAPRHSGFVRALAYAHAVRAGMAAVAAAGAGVTMATVSRSQEEGSFEREITGQSAKGYGDLAEGYAGAAHDFASIARARFKASTDTTDSLFMMVDLKKGCGLARVDKTSGAVTGLIDLEKDREPAYEVDAIDARVYYRPQPNALAGYQLGPSAPSAPGDAEAAPDVTAASAAPGEASAAPAASGDEPMGDAP